MSSINFRGATSLSLFTLLTSATPAPHSGIFQRQHEARVDQPMVNAIWSNSDSITPDLGGGSQITHGGGFSLIDDHGNVIYNDDSPANQSPCLTNDASRATFILSGSCFGEHGYAFSCRAGFSGNPELCRVETEDQSVLLGEAEGNEDADFYGIFATNEGYCGLSFPLALPEGCTPDSDWSVTKA
ncbi:hypothetical protein PMZ80_000024 [Knufia obscura]|uniref:Uncharacterized protein n=2 Tax=Knufia TaxID=430999 RepID=A0AAN8E8B9_9EURO|nr:hypothetical protein PMZ80_000024 [Knufia obscura]KAK5948794.1 hypothetical protein OHC33_010218 [Knufia fluminis]